MTMKDVKPIDVGQYIINHFQQKEKSITTLKLQKLVYYSQAWSMVWDDDCLFDENFEAWVNGPVVVSLFKALQGFYYCPNKIENADVNSLSDTQKETIDAVLKGYGDLTSYELVQLTHSEDPWKKARGNLPDNAISNNIISKQDINDFYTLMYEKQN